MDYLDTLRRNGWLADPSDRVRVAAIHAEGCPANGGRTCRCNPRLVLAADYPPRWAKDESRDLPLLDAASNE
jgi:hypothetical protein